SSADEEFILQVTRELLDEVVPLPAPAEASHEASESSAERVLVFGCPARDEVDELALRMLERLLDAKKCQFEIISTTTLSAELLSRVQEENPAIICIATIPSQGLAHTRYLCKRLRARFPELKILVCCYELPEAADRASKRLQEAGADQIATTLRESRDQLRPLLQVMSHLPPALEVVTSS